MRDYGDVLSFAPCLPSQLDGIRFRLRYQGRTLAIEIGRDQTRYRLLNGDPLDILHHGESITLDGSTVLERSCPALPHLEPIAPPHGRAACKRGIGAEERRARAGTRDISRET
jgi:alpha,alpha-trehalose phosphorylase